ncbi:rCG20949 [Rattus norvegicus]|uniref:RCG20949 n=1 Tax=Rattus norvegicus TaxID=10116 RepID=A6JE71_RAT|nr:rCG20949 [Rattus norvegicus]
MIPVCLVKDAISLENCNQFKITFKPQLLLESK